MCRVFELRWAERETPAELMAAHGYELGNINSTPRFPRLERFMKAEPRGQQPCSCGCGDAWRCWHKVKMDLVLGEARAIR
jgi:hypothetical protein